MARSTATSAGLGGGAAGGLRRDLPEQRGVSTLKIDADVGDVCGHTTRPLPAHRPAARLPRTAVVMPTAPTVFP